MKHYNHNYHFNPSKMLTYLLTYSMEQSTSLEANRFSASQEIPRILWNPKVHYRSHNCLPHVPILSQLDPVHTPHTLLPEDPFEYFSPIYAWVSQVVSFPQVSPPKPCVRLSSPPYALHAPPMSTGHPSKIIEFKSELLPLTEGL